MYLVTTLCAALSLLSITGEIIAFVSVGIAALAGFSLLPLAGVGPAFVVAGVDAVGMWRRKA